MTNIVYLADAIANFAEGSTCVEEYKATTSKKMTPLLIVSNETINKCNNDVLFKITQLELMLDVRQLLYKSVLLQCLHLF